MIDHIGFGVRDMAASLAFYDAALAPLGIAPLMRFPDEGEPQHVGYGRAGKPFLWISVGAPLAGSLHVAFAADDRAAVDAFHRAALGAGGRDNGPPGLRPEYHPGYYGAFVFDPDGCNVEAVHHTF